MKLREHPQMHLTYCLNVHPGESWEENFTAIRHEATAVRDRVWQTLRDAGQDTRDMPFGLGLRLSARAVGELRRERELSAFRAFLAHERMYVFTVNGFPYGPFHDEPVKQNVYAPDWRTPERRDYTLALAEVLARLLPDGVTGSISTVPGSYKAWIDDAEDETRMAHMLAETAAALDRIRHEHHREIVLALEPEPGCHIETTDETIRFFDGPLHQAGTRWLIEHRDCSHARAEALLRRHVGLCYDAAHMAVAFENLASGLDRLAAAGIRVAKVHLSAALRLHPEKPAMEELEAFDEDVYLHQVMARTGDGRVRSWDDLPAALEEASPCPDEEWRVHFHVPLFFEGTGNLGTTRDLLGGEFARRLAGGATEHLEIETYTFGVLPPSLRPESLSEGIAREFEWVLQQARALQ
jgi:sugar phosphate isomerase/epimerase